MKAKRNILEGKLQPPIGVSDWADFSQKNYCVDKTLLIKDLVDYNTRVALFTRPRRFGKTSALRMLRSFFEKTEEDNSRLFTDKKIWAAGDKYRAMQGKYPVIYLTFKDHKAETWESAERQLIRDVGDEVGRHFDSVCSDWGIKEKQDRLLRIKQQCNTTIDETAAEFEANGYTQPLVKIGLAYFKKRVSLLQVLRDVGSCEDK